MLQKTILQLPDSNRDTMAFLVLHLQKVALNSKVNRMTTSSLAKIFGPTVISSSMANPPHQSIINEQIKQVKTMECLIELDSEFWNDCLRKPEKLRSKLYKLFDSSSIFILCFRQIQFPHSLS